MVQQQFNLTQNPPFWKSYTDFTSYAKMFEEQSARFSDRVYLHYQEEAATPNENNTSPLVYKTLTYGQVNQITEYLANEWDKILPMNTECVAILSDDPMQIILALYSVFKLGIPFFPLSTRNSETAIIHLLNETKAGYLIASEKYSKMAKACAAKIGLSSSAGGVANNNKQNNSFITDVKIWDDFNIDLLFAEAKSAGAVAASAVLFVPEVVDGNDEGNEGKRNNNSSNNDHPSKRQCTRKRRRVYSNDPEDIVLILHSSGTTSVPKPIRESTRYLAFSQFEQIIKYLESLGPDFSLKPTDVMLLPIPFFHALSIGLFLTITLTGGSAVVFKQLPPLPKDLLTVAKTQGATTMITAPIILEYLEEFLKNIQDENEVKGYSQVLKQIKYCLFAGAQLSRSVGDSLHEKGLNVRTFSGSTEMGFLGISKPTIENKRWNCFELSEHVLPYLEFEPFGDNLYHIVVRGDCPSLAIGISNRPNGAFATNDLLSEDSPGSGYWRIVARMDDTLVMKNGEKTNAASMELDICEEPVIKSCSVIGANKECAAVLIELNKNIALDFSPTQLTTKVYDAVHKANTAAPSHSTIMVPHMVYILPLNQQLPTTAKGSVRRKEVIVQFKTEIDIMYDNFISKPTKDESETAIIYRNQDKGKTTNGNMVDLKSLDNDEDFLLHAAAQVLNRPHTEIKSDISLFDYGLDSLRAIQLRNIMMARYKSVSPSFLFEHPSLESMINVLVTATIPEDDKDRIIVYQKQQEEKRYQQTRSILQEYLERAGKDFPSKHAAISTSNQHQKNKNKKNIILLTGSTGCLGAFLLRDMIISSKVEKIYCMVRGKKDTLMERIQKSFEKRCIDTSLLSKGKVEAIPMDLNAPYLGLDDINVYKKLQKEVTIIQCCGWLVDFNQTVDHFERECIRGLYNLIKFSHRGQEQTNNLIHVHFVSSISATGNYQALYPSATRIPESSLPEDPHVAVPMGYAQSKYIVERLFDFLAKEKNMPCFIERLGQVCGDTEHGVWNTTESYPRMFVGGASMMNLMPDLMEYKADWIPVDYAAKSIFEIMLSNANSFNSGQEGNFIYHIVNPKQIPWSSVLDAIRKCDMEFKLVKPMVWLDELKKHQDNPAYPLLPFFENYWQQSSLVKYQYPVWETEKSIRVSSSLAHSPVFNPELLKKYLFQWKKSNFIN